MLVQAIAGYCDPDSLSRHERIGRTLSGQIEAERDLSPTIRARLDLDRLWLEAFEQAMTEIPRRVLGVPPLDPAHLPLHPRQAPLRRVHLRPRRGAAICSPNLVAAESREGRADMTDINTRIDNEVKSQDVVLFMKGTPQFPMCGFSSQVVQILNYVGVPFKGVNVLEDQEIREGIKAYSNWPTIPQLYVKGEFVGGGDSTREMFQAGELQQLLAEKGIPVKQTVA
jgi:monothiol glutaredoxin